MLGFVFTWVVWYGDEENLTVRLSPAITKTNRETDKGGRERQVKINIVTELFKIN